MAAELHESHVCNTHAERTQREQRLRIRHVCHTYLRISHKADITDASQRHESPHKQAATTSIGINIIIRDCDCQNDDDDEGSAIFMSAQAGIEFRAK